jgi:hypothetical protein
MANKAWRGRKRLAKKLNPDYFTEGWYRELLHYLLDAKPGDLIHSCTGYNHRIKKVEFFRCESPNGKTSIIYEACVEDDTGRLHYFPGGGCVAMTETREEIEAYILSWDCPQGWELIKTWKFFRMGKEIEVLRLGVHVLNEDGTPLSDPEFEALYGSHCSGSG